MMAEHRYEPALSSIHQLQEKFFDLHRLLQNAKARTSLSLDVRALTTSLLELVEE